jgi:hypothetical protein
MWTGPSVQSPAMQRSCHARPNLPAPDGNSMLPVQQQVSAGRVTRKLNMPSACLSVACVCGQGSFGVCPEVGLMLCSSNRTAKDLYVYVGKAGKEARHLQVHRLCVGQRRQTLVSVFARTAV